jgi:hypothetical protein
MEARRGRWRSKKDSGLGPQLWPWLQRRRLCFWPRWKVASVLRWAGRGCMYVVCMHGMDARIHQVKQRESAL